MVLNSTDIHNFYSIIPHIISTVSKATKYCRQNLQICKQMIQLWLVLDYLTRLLYNLQRITKPTLTQTSTCPTDDMHRANQPDTNTGIMSIFTAKSYLK